MNTKLILSFLFVILIITGCNTVDPPPGEKPTLALKLEEVSCTEAWIKLTTTNLQLPTKLILYKDDVAQNNILCYGNTLLYIDSLLPNQTYKFHTTIQSSSHTSNELSVTTMDTTSHSFTFESWTFGTIGSSTLYDVAIINESNIWAVGEILVADTSINGYTAYNAVHWNGSQWELKRILYQGGFWIIRTIFAFSENDIWFSAFVRFDGQNYIELPIPPILTGWSINKIWGSSSSDLYVVGNNGNIARYLNGAWIRIESGTELNINDIWGDYNDKTGEWEILAVASNIFISFEKEVIKINHSNSQILSRDGIDETLRSVWFKANIKYYVVGSGTYKKNKLSDVIWEGDPLDITDYFENQIRANDINDVFVVGAFGELLHFNGVKWKSYLNETGLFNGAYLSVGIKNKILVAVGYEAAQAKIIVGNRE